MIDKRTLVRGESLSINVELKIFDKIPIDDPVENMVADALLQNHVRVPLRITKLDKEGWYNLYSDIDTRRIIGTHFLVNVIIKDRSADAPEALNIASFNHTFYVLNSATDIEHTYSPSPSPTPSAGHSVVYYINKEYYDCQNMEKGQTINPPAPTRDGYVFSGWTGIPSDGKMPDHCLSVWGDLEPAHGRILDSGKIGDDAYFTIYEDGYCIITGTGAADYNLKEQSPVYYNYVKHLLFKDGIETIGGRLYPSQYSGMWGTNNIRTVELPSTLKDVKNGGLYFTSANDGTDHPVNLIFPSSTRSISGSFGGTAVGSVTLNEGLLSIDKLSLTSCDAISIPTTVEEITGVRPFGLLGHYRQGTGSSGQSLTPVIIIKSKKITSLGEGFLGDLGTLIGGKDIRVRVDLSQMDNLKLLGTWCMINSDIEKLIIPRSLESISSTFAKPTSANLSIQQICYLGSEEEWNRINISPNGNDIIFNTPKVFNYIP